MACAAGIFGKNGCIACFAFSALLSENDRSRRCEDGGAADGLYGMEDRGLRPWTGYCSGSGSGSRENAAKWQHASSIFLSVCLYRAVIPGKDSGAVLCLRTGRTDLCDSAGGLLLRRSGSCGGTGAWMDVKGAGRRGREKSVDQNNGSLR